MRYGRTAWGRRVHLVSAPYVEFQPDRDLALCGATVEWMTYRPMWTREICSRCTRIQKRQSEATQ